MLFFSGWRSVIFSNEEIQKQENTDQYRKNSHETKQILKIDSPSEKGHEKNIQNILANFSTHHHYRKMTAES